MKFYSAKQYSTKLKATIQSSGRLGFTEDTARELELDTKKYIKIGNDGESMYLVVSNSADEDGFKVCKAGAYYYLPTAILFMSLGCDFRRKTIIFDLTRAIELDSECNGKVYKLNKRESDKKKKTM